LGVCISAATPVASAAGTSSPSPAAGASEVLILPLKNQAFPSFLILFLLRFRILHLLPGYYICFLDPEVKTRAIKNGRNPRFLFRRLHRNSRRAPGA